MRIVQLGSDRSTRGSIARGSASSQRQEAYANAFGHIDDISFTLRSDNFLPFVSDAMSVHPTNSISRFLYGFDAIRIARKLPRPDVVSAQDPFEAGLAGLFIARMRGAPLHVQVHTDFLSPEYVRHSLLNRVRVFIAGIVLRRATRIRVVSDRIKRSIEARYQIHAPITVLPVFADLERLRVPRSNLGMAERFGKFNTKLLVVARLEPEKNIELAIRAFAKAAPGNACLIIVGEGSASERLQALARILHVSDRIFFEGQREAASYYPIADLVLVTSRYEGYGLVIVEGLASGKPVISTDVGVAREAGAMVAVPEKFAEVLAEWFKKGPREGILKNYTFENFETYIRAYCGDIIACADSNSASLGEQKRIGLAFHHGTSAFLERAYDMVYERTENGMPLYRDKNGKRYWGGFGSFYTVCIGEDPGNIRSDAEQLGRRYGLIEGCFSLSADLFSARHVNIILTIPKGMSAENRLDLYERNIKKHIRNTVARSSLRYVIESAPPQWYELYRRAHEENGHMPHPEKWFAAIEESFGADVIVASAYDGEKLSGALYCIRHGDYLHLLSIATDPAYRAERVDSGLYDRMILYAIENGIHFVDFGLTGKNAKSLIAFKLGFGGTPYYISNRTFGNPAHRSLDFLQRLPRAVSRRFFARAHEAGRIKNQP